MEDGKPFEVVFAYPLRYHQTNSDWIIEWLKARVVQVNGVDPLFTPELKGYSAIADLYVMPIIKVSSSGANIELINVNEALEVTFRNLVNLSGQRNAETVGFFNQLKSSDLIRRVLTNQCLNVWNAWVGHWVDFSMAAGEEEAIRFTPPYQTKLELAGDQKLQNLGVINRDDNLQHYVFSQRIFGPGLIEILEEGISSLAMVVGRIATNRPTEFQGGEHFCEAQVHINPQNLHPSWAKRTESITLLGKSGKAFTRRESREYFFKWARSTNHTELGVNQSTK
jgi:hypothetical protein